MFVEQHTGLLHKFIVKERFYNFYSFWELSDAKSILVKLSTDILCQPKLSQIVSVSINFDYHYSIFYSILKFWSATAAY